ncbi:MAG: [citrate (pro-3S)-lyase] ligase [Propionibacteriaceae bacterium]|jgi:[citrate (pro-3S)-lyase] ligase|nr:[citrate (pro-3S)-lyase] ligase [Propionibacteriaceae bacterium]
MTTGDMRAAAAIDAFLAANHLRRDPDVTVFAVAQAQGRLVGCLGLARDVVKCAAIDEEHRGENLLGRLLTDIRYQALRRGQAHLCCYTKPVYAEQFTALGFHPIAEVPNLAVLLEDDPHGLSDYTASLAARRRPGSPVGGVVVNADPFTLGHAHLIEFAAQQCAVVHVFVVGEDVSHFRYKDRLAMVRAGVAALPSASRIVVHPGSRYVVSRLTFPQYFLKEAADVSRAYTGIDVQLFRRHIAPALGITDRFVGEEPASAITARYNAEMADWLRRPDIDAPPVAFHVIDRLGLPDVPFISASLVRSRLAAGDWAGVAELTPPTTSDYLRRLAAKPAKAAVSAELAAAPPPLTAEEAQDIMAEVLAEVPDASVSDVPADLSDAVSTAIVADLDADVSGLCAEEPPAQAAPKPKAARRGRGGPRPQPPAFLSQKPLAFLSAQLS